MPPKRQAPAASEGPEKKSASTEYPCSFDGCPKSYASLDSLTRHIKSAHQGVRFRCPVLNCDKEYNTRAGLAKHTKSFHQGVKYPCSFSNCDKEFSTQSGRDAHIHSVHEKIRYRCHIDDCGKLYSHLNELNSHIKSFHQGVRYSCEYADCQREFTDASSRRKHVRSAHQGIRHFCRYDNCDKTFSFRCHLEDHIRFAHVGEILCCPFDDCEKIFSSKPGFSSHVNTIHLGIRYPCPCLGCDRIYTEKRSQEKHVKSVHGTLEDAAELYEKKLQLRKLLAEKEAQGICSTTKSCQNPAIKGSFCCNYHEKTVNSVNKALQEKSEAGRLSDSSIKTADEFALLLQRQMIHLEPEEKAALHLLAQGFDDDSEIAAKSYDMDTEFCWTGEYTAMDITIERMNGEEVVSTRVELEMDVEELQALCSNPRSKACVRKVYGNSDKT